MKHPRVTNHKHTKFLTIRFPSKGEASASNSQHHMHAKENFNSPTKPDKPSQTSHVSSNLPNLETNNITSPRRRSKYYVLNVNKVQNGRRLSTLHIARRRLAELSWSRRWIKAQQQDIHIKLQLDGCKACQLPKFLHKERWHATRKAR